MRIIIYTSGRIIDFSNCVLELTERNDLMIFSLCNNVKFILDTVDKYDLGLEIIEALYKEIKIQSTKNTILINYDDFIYAFLRSK